MTFAEMFVDDAEPLRNPDQGAGTSVLERPETKVATPIVLRTTYPRTVSLNRVRPAARWWPCAVRFGSPSTTRPSTRFAPTASGFMRK